MPVLNTQFHYIYIRPLGGKLITKIKHYSDGWDGTFNVKLLASDDYWYTAKKFTRRQRKTMGHFSLKRYMQEKHSNTQHLIILLPQLFEIY
jgi:gliding motility-associated-like protein